MKGFPLLLGVAALLVGVPAAAQGADAPRFCPNRPSLGSSACTTEPGHVQVEASAIDWELDRTRDERSDTIVLADTLVRLGVGPATELQIGWAPQTIVRTRDRTSGAVTRASGIGDVRLAIRQNLRNPDANGLSFGIEPFVVLPTAPSDVGDGDWSAGAVLPITYELGDKWQLAFTTQGAAQADEDGHGRHFDANGILGVSYSPVNAVTVTGELYAERDDDPADRRRPLAAAASIAWQPTKRTQLDLLIVGALNHDAPDLRLVVGGALVL